MSRIKMIGEVKTLHPVLRLAVDRILSDMRAKGWDAVIGSGMRSDKEQDALFAKGRAPLPQVNARLKEAGLPAISAKDNIIVTKAKGGESFHNKRHSLLPHGPAAMDVVVAYAVDIVDGRFGWHPRDPRFWTDLGQLAKKYGCEWGGDWKTPDVAHVQLKLIDSAPRTSLVV